MRQPIEKVINRSGHPRIIPGFAPAMGVTITMLSLVVLIPIASLVVSAAGLGGKEFLSVITQPQIMAGYRVSIFCAVIAALLNGVFGLILAWILVRYDFPGKNFLDGIIELPLALPTAVAGISLTSLYSDQGWIGKFFAGFGIKIAYTQIGIIIAMIFVGIPFVVRAIQPVLENIDAEYEEAASLFGASPRQIFFKVIFPEILPAMLAGFGLALARALGEYGSVVFIAGNIPFKTQIAPLLIMTKLEQYKYSDATAIALVLLVISFILMFLINGVQLRLASIAKGKSA